MSENQGRDSPLEVLEGSIEGPQDQGVRERRRVPRLSLVKEVFRLSVNGQLFGVTDLSPLGMGLRVADSTELVLFPLGMAVQGVLSLQGHKVSVQGRVRFLSKAAVGIEFESISAEAQTVLTEALDPHRLGESMRPMPTGAERDVWWHGAAGADLWVWQWGGEASFSRALLLVHGHFVEWTAGAALQVGNARPSADLPEHRGPFRWESLWLEPEEDSGALVAQKQVAKQVLLSCNLPKPLKNSLISSL